MIQGSTVEGSDWTEGGLAWIRYDLIFLLVADVIHNSEVTVASRDAPCALCPCVDALGRQKVRSLPSGNNLLALL